MPEEKLRILSPLKEHWSDPETHTWKDESRKTLLQQFRDGFYDYQRYDRERQWAGLEAMIAGRLFGANENLAPRALRENNMLRGYNAEQRRKARDVAYEMKKIAGKKADIEVQAVPVLLRLEEDVKAKRTDSRQICVFRVKCGEEGVTHKFVDSEGRTYGTWSGCLGFLDGNKLPAGMLCYTVDGFTRARGEDQGGNYQEPQIKFGETPECRLLERGISVAQTASAWLSPIATIGLFWNPIGWVGAGLMAATYTFSALSMGTQLYNVVDKAAHGQRYGNELFNFVGSIGTLVIQKALPRYLRRVAAEHRQLSSLEHVVITAVLSGMKAPQVMGFLGTLYAFASKKEITALDVLNLVVSCQNMYCCIITPWTAQKMMNNVRNELAQEEHKKYVEEEKKQERLRGEIEDLKWKTTSTKAEKAEKQSMMDEKKRQLAESIERGKGYRDEFQAYKSTTMEQVLNDKKELQKLVDEEKDLEAQWNRTTEGEKRREIKGKLKDIKANKTECEKKIVANQRLEQQQTKDKMEDSGAKREFQKFVDKETNTKNADMEIDSNGRIIQAMFEMDAEKVFKIASDTNTKICFTNGETLDLAINQQFDIHPRRIADLSGVNGGSDQLKEVFQLTKNYNNGNMKKDVYIPKIKEILEPHGMMSRAEVSKVKTEMKDALGIWSPFISTRWDSLSPAEAFRIRDAIDGVPLHDRGNALKAAQLVSNGLNYDDPKLYSDCLDLVKHSVEVQQSKFNEVTNGNPDGASNFHEMDKICESILGASPKETARLRKANFSKDAVESLLYEKLSKERNPFVEYVKAQVKEVEMVSSSEDFNCDSIISAVKKLMEYGKENKETIVQGIGAATAVYKYFTGQRSNTGGTDGGPSGNGGYPGPGPNGGSPRPYQNGGNLEIEPLGGSPESDGNGDNSSPNGGSPRPYQNGGNLEIEPLGGSPESDGNGDNSGPNGGSLSPAPNRGNSGFSSNGGGPGSISNNGNKSAGPESVSGGFSWSNGSRQFSFFGTIPASDILNLLRDGQVRNRRNPGTDNEGLDIDDYLDTLAIED